MDSNRVRTYERIDEPVVAHNVAVYDRPRRSRFWLGFIAAIVAIAAAIGIWAVASDDDNDGSVNVPSVDVDADVDAPPNP